MIAAAAAERGGVGDIDLVLLYGEQAAALADPEHPYQAMVGAVSLSNVAAAHLRMIESVDCVDFADPESPLFTAALQERGRCIQWMTGEYAAADQALTRARNTFPPDHLVLNNSVELLLLKGQPRWAESLAIAALKQFPDSAPLMWTLGDVYAELGRCDEQSLWVERALKVDRGFGAPMRPCVEAGF
jgi:tetratricopeptide (TPR) repeat protein